MGGQDPPGLVRTERGERNKRKEDCVKIAADLRFKNGSLWEIVAKVGSSKALAAELNVNEQTVSNWLNLKYCPTAGVYENSYTEEVERKLESIFGGPASEIFPPGLDELCKQMRPEDRRRVTMAEVSREKLVDMTTKRAGRLCYTDNLSSQMDNETAGDKIKDALATLNERERKIIEFRYGLSDGHVYTLDECVSIFNVTRERIRQIEAKAIRKLQQPGRAGMLIGLLGDSLPVGTYEQMQDRDDEIERNKTASIRSILKIKD